MDPIARLLEGLASTLREQLAARETQSTIIDQVRNACLSESRDPSDAEASTVTAALAERGRVDEQIAATQARQSELQEEQRSNDAARALARSMGGGNQRDRAPARVGQEQRTYGPGSQASFFRDAYSSMFNGDFEARQRLERHSAEVRVEREASERALNTGGVAGLVIPQYLIDQAALVARAGRPVANNVQHLPLPDQGMTVIVPRGTTGVSVASQAAENTPVASTDQVWQNLNVPVVTIAGQAPVSRQLLERGGAEIDRIIYGDLAGAYAAELDRQVVNGSGASNQMLGILNTAGTNQATAFTAPVTAATFYSKSAGQKSAVETTRFLPPTRDFMHPQRWNWLLSQLDNAGRPLAVPRDNGPMNSQAVAEDPAYGTVVGTFLGLPVVTDANIPTSVGSGPEDVEIIARAEDLLLWEVGDGMPKELRFDQTLGNQLTTILVAYNYAAFTAGRYPTAVGKVGGNSAAGFGLVAPTF